MKPLFQPVGSRLCGQTCVAMIADVSLSDAIKAVGHAHGTTTRELASALRKFGIDCTDRLKRISKKSSLPERCIVGVVWDKKNGGYHRHWIVRWDGEFFNPDPSDGYRMTSFLEIRGRKVQGLKNKSIESANIWHENNLTFVEIIRQEYGGNNCIISAGFVEGKDKPSVDTMYLKLEKDGVESTLLLLRPDEMQAIVWISSGAVWSHLMREKAMIWREHD